MAWRRGRLRRDLVATRSDDALVEVGFVDASGELRTIADRGAGRTVQVERDGPDWAVETRIPALGGHALGPRRDIGMPPTACVLLY